MTQLLITPPPAALWQQLREQKEFPILEETRTRIRTQMQSSRVSFDELAPSIEKDPALCLNLQLLAASQRPESLEQISGAASCLSLLGMQELVRLMKHLPVVPADPDEPALALYRRALLTAAFAGNLAAHWAQIKGNPSVSYARWSTMLSNAPLWSALLNWPQAANWLYLLSQGHGLKQATEQVFGQPGKHWQDLLQTLQLPVMAQDVFSAAGWPTSGQWRILRHHDPRDLDNQRPLLHLCQQPAMLSLMASQLAWHLHMAPESGRTARWLALTCHWLGRPRHLIAPQVRSLQVQTTHHQHSSAGTGLHLLLSPVPVAEPYQWIAPDEDSIHSATPARQPPLSDNRQPKVVPQLPRVRHGDETYMKKLLRQLQQEPDSFGDWHYLMRGMLKGVTQGIGLPSACVALLNKDKTALRVFYSEGMSEQAPMKHFMIDLRQPSLFSKLLEKQASVLLTADNRQKFLSRIPPAMAERMPQQTMIMSIDAGAGPIGLVMGFAGEEQDALSTAEYFSFKNLCMVTSQSLAALRANTEKRR